jgi:Na+/H+ antiporter NhaA
MVAVLAGSLCVFITMQLFRFSRIDISLANMTISHWRSLVLLGFISSIFNTAGNMLALGDAMSSELHLEVIFTFIIGDTLGTLVCLLILMLGFRLRRLAKTE